MKEKGLCKSDTSVLKTPRFIIKLGSALVFTLFNYSVQKTVDQLKKVNVQLVVLVFLLIQWFFLVKGLVGGSLSPTNLSFSSFPDAPPSYLSQIIADDYLDGQISKQAALDLESFCKTLGAKGSIYQGITRTQLVNCSVLSKKNRDDQGSLFYLDLAKKLDPNWSGWAK